MLSPAALARPVWLRISAQNLSPVPASLAVLWTSRPAATRPYSASIHCPCRAEEPHAGQPLTAQSPQGPAAGALAPVQTVAVPAASEGEVTLPLPAASSHLSGKQPTALKAEADVVARPEGPDGSSQKAPNPKAAASKGSPLARGVQAIFDGYAGCCGRMNMHGEQPHQDVHLHCAQLSHRCAGRTQAPQAAVRAPAALIRC